MSEKITFTIDIPTDNEGFTLLKCSLCGEMFKLKPKDYKDDSIFEIYCPCCGLVSDNYITEDVMELAMTMVGNYAIDLFAKKNKNLERKAKGSSAHFKATKRPKHKKEMPIMLTINALEGKIYPCCNMEAKIKFNLKMGGSYCPYCGVVDYGVE